MFVMKCSDNKFIIFISLIVLLNIFFIFSKYDLKIFTRSKPPLNMFDYDLRSFKHNYPYSKIKIIGFYTDVKDVQRIHVLYELQDSIMPIFIEDNINHDYVLCFSDSNACENFAKNENMKIEGVYNKIILCKRKDKK